jgi:hypothetical protein
MRWWFIEFLPHEQLSAISHQQSAFSKKIKEQLPAALGPALGT